MNIFKRWQNERGKDDLYLCCVRFRVQNFWKEVTKIPYFFFIKKYFFILKKTLKKFPTQLITTFYNHVLKHTSKNLIKKYLQDIWSFYQFFTISKTAGYLEFLPVLYHFENRRLFEVFEMIRTSSCYCDLFHQTRTGTVVSPGSEILRKPENNSYIENQIPTNTGLKFLTFLSLESNHTFIRLYEFIPTECNCIFPKNQIVSWMMFQTKYLVLSLHRNLHIKIRAG